MVVPIRSTLPTTTARFDIQGILAVLVRRQGFNKDDDPVIGTAHQKHATICLYMNRRQGILVLGGKEARINNRHDLSSGIAHQRDTTINWIFLSSLPIVAWVQGNSKDWARTMFLLPGSSNDSLPIDRNPCRFLALGKEITSRARKNR